MTAYQVMTVYHILQSLGIPCTYSHFRTGDAPKEPPYIVYMGNGQDTFDADNTHYYRNNRYRVEYYFKEKNEAQEAAIEQALLDHGFLYEKSEDVFVDSEGVFVIYYYI